MMDALTGWGELELALAAFFATHLVPARPGVRGRIVGLVGLKPYIFAYSLLSVALLGWLIAAAGSAPYVEVWPREPWQTAVPAVGMLVALQLAVFGLSTPNPLSLGPRSTTFDPDRPGVAGLVRHPVLWAALIWSVSHMVPNGDLAHLIVFGLFAALSAGGMAILDRRKQRLLGRDGWQALARRTSNWPLTSLARGWRPTFDIGTALRVLAGVLLYGLLVWTHGYFTGIPLV